MNNAPQTAEQINRPLTGHADSTVPAKTEMKFDQNKIPLPVAGKNPVRFSIGGITEKIPDLKKIVEGIEGMDPDLKTYVLSELDELTSNAAEVHLHDVEFGDGEGFDLHLSVRARHLGEKPGVVFKRKS